MTECLAVTDVGVGVGKESGKDESCRERIRTGGHSLGPLCHTEGRCVLYRLRELDILVVSAIKR